MTCGYYASRGKGHLWEFNSCGHFLLQLDVRKYWAGVLQRLALQHTVSGAFAA